MISSLTLEDGQGVQHPFISSTRKLVQAQGLAGITPLRQVLSDKPNRGGSNNRSRYQQDRPVTLNGILLGATETEIWQTFDDLQFVLGQAAQSERTLRYVRGDGLALQMLVKVDGLFDAAIKATDGGVVLPYQVQLRASDPNSYSDALATIVGQPLNVDSGGSTYPNIYPDTFIPSASGLAAFTNNGTADTWPTIRVHGDCANPIVHLEGTPSPASIKIIGSVAASDYLELNSADRTVLLNGTFPRAKMLDVANTQWFALPARTSGWVKLTADSGAGWVELIYRHAYS